MEGFQWANRQKNTVTICSECPLAERLKNISLPTRAEDTHDILSRSKKQIFHGTDCLEETESPSSEIFRNKLDKYQSGLISAYLILPWMTGLIKWPHEVYLLLHFHDGLHSDFS